MEKRLRTSFEGVMSRAGRKEEDPGAGTKRPNKLHIPSWAFGKRSPLGTSTPKQHATPNPDEASSVEIRKPDTPTYSSSRDTRTSVSARSVTPVRVAEEQHEDSSSSDESLSSDVPSETQSDTSDEAQAR